MAAPSSASTRETLLKFFDQADADKNGYLSIKELKVALARQGYNLAGAKLKKQFKLFDQDGDNKVSRDEFIAGMGEVPESAHEEASVRMMFRAFDKNGDGVIDRKELGQIFRNMKQRKMSDAEINHLMATVDKNRSGKIEYEEFIEFFAKKLSP